MEISRKNPKERRAWKNKNLANFEKEKNSKKWQKSSKIDKIEPKIAIAREAQIKIVNLSGFLGRRFQPPGRIRKIAKNGRKIVKIWEILTRP